MDTTKKSLLSARVLISQRTQHKSHKFGSMGKGGAFYIPGTKACSKSYFVMVLFALVLVVVLSRT